MKIVIEKYIKYYNEKRIREKLGWMSPVQYQLNLWLYKNNHISHKTVTIKKSNFWVSLYVTEATVFTHNNQSISIFSRIRSSKEKNFASMNSITFQVMECVKKLFGKATFVMDRGYDDNKMFLKLDSLNQDYVIRLTRKRKLFYQLILRVASGLTSFF